MRKAYKSLISLAVVLIAGLNFIVPAFAQDPFSSIAIGGIGGASGAGLFGSMAGMSGIDIAWSQSGPEPLDAMWNVLNPDHVYFSGEKHEATGVDEDVWDYITVDIGDWLSAQSDFIINFAQENNVQDNDSGQVSNPWSWRGASIGSRSGTFTGEGYYSWVSGVNLQIFQVTGFNPWRATLYIDGQSVRTIAIASNPTIYLSIDEVDYLSMHVTSPVTLNYKDLVSGGTPSNVVNWSSGQVNTSVFDGWENAKVKIPHNISGLTTNWSISDFTNAINDLWDQGLQGQIVIEDTDQPVPPTPVPSTPLGEMPFEDWVDLWGQGIYQQLENQSDALDLIGTNGEDQIEELESIDSNLDDLNQTAESIDTNIAIGNGILGGIRSLAQSAVNFLEGIAEHVGELVEEIVEGTETLIAGILNQIPQAFGIIFGPIKQASSIWHYVVEWIQSIGAPFQFIWSMASGTSYYIILPVYASLAAAVVLAFYKRFGK